MFAKSKSSQTTNFKLIVLEVPIVFLIPQILLKKLHKREVNKLLSINIILPKI